eukprot:5464986-Prorocentrum_lima.AAC.1
MGGMSKKPGLAPSKVENNPSTSKSRSDQLGSVGRLRFGSGEAEGEAGSPGGCWATTSARLGSPPPSGPDGEAAAGAAD